MRIEWWSQSYKIGAGEKRASTAEQTVTKALGKELGL